MAVLLVLVVAQNRFHLTCYLTLNKPLKLNIMKKTILMLSGLAMLSLMTSSCSKDETKTTSTPNPTLYERVGGTSLVADPRKSGSMVEQG
jgi:hypothetical protein